MLLNFFLGHRAPLVFSKAIYIQRKSFSFCVSSIPFFLTNSYFFVNISVALAERAFMISKKLSVFSEAPPTKAPSTSGCANKSAALDGLQLPPYKIVQLSAISCVYR